MTQQTIIAASPLPEQRVAWEQLYRGYAAYYRVPMTDDILATVWRWIQDPDEPFHCRLALSVGNPIGLAHFRAMPSPLRGKRVGFLDDLFVEPDHRGSGAVDVLLRHSRRRGAARAGH